MSDDINSGTGWFEVIRPVAATTEIVRVMEDGSIYCPEGVLTRSEFAFAAARGDAHLLVRADDPDWLARVKREAKADAWDEGARWAYEELTGKPEGGHWLMPEENPYRPGASNG